ncbi:putative FMN-dependent dehydrogenase [Seiridium unicorne]|uniref:FMN-dependent dehydrogenase n=1 Tax=Seiridium unicorne TaxID=138068 RepID=A0ABR2UMM9_9PEZI
MQPLSTIVRDMELGCGDESRLTSYSCFCTASFFKFRWDISTAVLSNCGITATAQATSAIGVFNDYCALGMDKAQLVPTTYTIPLIIVSNHGRRNLDRSPSPPEVALEIYEKDSSIFHEAEIVADDGVRYGTDALKLLSLGVKAVGVERPFLFSNADGQPGIEKVAKVLKTEIAGDGANIGVADIKQITPDYVNWTPNY